jgi:hypothetical protein
MKLYAKISAVMVAATLLAAATTAFAGKTYSEDEFITGFSGKSKKLIVEKLGQPFKKQQSVKPSNANSMVGSVGKEQNSKPVQVEMWYYKNLVKYDDKNTYKETEVTFVNDRVMNIGFFKNR